ncbi:MAG: aminodeoxychorismate/anthranilate synthase component II [Bacillota bacterium]|nr:aminodeoxychorismate/anthranilate synthase component II [Bacillota bacterium]
MITIIDNYDSFTYNLYQYIGSINPDIKVYRNDKLSPGEVLSENPSHIVLSPGPGYPAGAGICIDLIKANSKIPMLGVCLGHQAIGEAFGGLIVKAPQIMHGKADDITINNKTEIFKGLPDTIRAGRYHSLVIDPVTLPDCLAVTANSPDGCIMGIRHKEYPIFGIQFHPESVLTDNGIKIIKNFLEVR